MVGSGLSESLLVPRPRLCHRAGTCFGLIAVLLIDDIDNSGPLLPLIQRLRTYDLSWRCCRYDDRGMEFFPTIDAVFLYRDSSAYSRYCALHASSGTNR